jgi:hypothetical protein
MRKKTPRTPTGRVGIRGPQGSEKRIQKVPDGGKQRKKPPPGGYHSVTPVDHRPATDKEIIPLQNIPYTMFLKNQELFAIFLRIIITFCDTVDKSADCKRRSI